MITKIKQLCNLLIWTYALVVSIKGLGELAADHTIALKNRKFKK